MCKGECVPIVRKIKIVILLFLFTAALGLMSNTYSRYVASAKSDINVSFSKWQILLNNEDITQNKDSSVEIKPILEDNENVAQNKIAPSSKGYFDIDIDPSNVDLSFKYTVDLYINNEFAPDIVITKYSIIPSSLEEGSDIEIISLIDNSIENTLLYNSNDVNEFAHEPFTIRIYFQWYEGENEIMSDKDDTEIGLLAASEDLTLEMTANISFEQIID